MGEIQDAHVGETIGTHASSFFMAGWGAPEPEWIAAAEDLATTGPTPAPGS